MLYHTKPFVDFDPTLPILKSTIISPKLPFHTHNIFRQTNSTFLPTYSRLKINKNITLHSKSNFSESSNHFHIQTQMDYKLSKNGFLAYMVNKIWTPEDIVDFPLKQYQPH